MLRTIAHRILSGTATLAVLLFAYVAMTWSIYRIGQPLCYEIDSELYYYCLSYADHMQMLTTRWRPPHPYFDYEAVVFIGAAFVAVFALREWIGGTHAVRLGQSQLDNHWRL